MFITAAWILFALFCLALGLGRSWNDETQAERNDLVFAHRNRQYGAYRLRDDYGNHVGVAILACVGALCTVVVVFTAIAHIGPPPIVGLPQHVVVDVDLGRVLEQPPLPPGPLRTAAAESPSARPDPEKLRAVEVVDPAVAIAAPRMDTTSTTGHTVNVPGSGMSGADPNNSGAIGTLAGLDLGRGILTRDEVQEVPMFPGGDAAMAEWVRRNLDFPADGAAKDVIYVQFTVGLDGSVGDVQAVKGQQPTYKRAAERTIRRMPRWKPARMNGHEVRCRLILPIRFETR